MTFATSATQTGINPADLDSLLGPSIRPGLAATEQTGIPAQARDRIRRAVSQVQERDLGTGEKLRQPRAAFVRPATLSFARGGAALDAARLLGKQTEPRQKLPVVTLNLSAIGAGIIVSQQHEPLPRQVTLEVDGITFDCEVRWSKVLGTNVTRYGLLLRDAQPAAIAGA
jgi:hypothetical protein